jgi:DNA-binding NtrC family response regulator
MTAATLTAQRVSTTALLVAGKGEEAEFSALLRTVGYEPLLVHSTEAMNGVKAPVSVCLIDLRQNGDAIRMARAIRSKQPHTVVIGIADPLRPSAAAEAIRAGVFDVLPRPPSSRDLEALLANAREQASLAASPQHTRPAEQMPFGVIGASPAMRAVMDLVQRAAPGRCGMLICGERGTGREMIARAIHAHGANPYAPFIKVDCSSPIPEDLEQQLFGMINKRPSGGAPERRSLERIDRRSRLIDAAGGILFLENVVELPARGQARLVRILRDREVFLEDGREAIPLDVRPIASIDSSMEAAIEEGRLREDLHERLSLIRIDVPALRQRREDIPVLATHFLKEMCRENGKPVKTFTRSALTLLAALPWRGNAPELKGLLERLILLAPGGLIRLEDVLAHTQFESAVSPTGLDATLRQARAKFERDYIAAVLQHHHGRIADAAGVLGIQRTNLYRKMRRLNLLRPKAAPREA